MSPVSFIKSRSTLWLCYGGMVCIALTVNLPPIYYTTFARDFGGSAGLTSEQLGRISALIFVGLVAGILVSGPLADRWGAKTFAVIGVALSTVGLGAMASARDYGQLLAAAAFLGFGAGALDMVMSPIVCALYPERRATSLNWLHAFYCIGGVCTVSLGALALHWKLPWRHVAFCGALLPALLTLGFSFAAIPRQLHASGERHSPFGLLVCPAFLAGLLTMALAGATENAMEQWLPAYVERALGYRATDGALALGGFSLGMAAGRIGAGQSLHGRSPLRLMLGACGATIFLYLLGGLSPAPLVSLCACIVSGLAVSCLWPTALALTADQFPKGGASMFALLVGAGNAGCFAAPWGIGIVADTWGLGYGIAAGAVCPAALLLLLVLHPPKTAPLERESP